MCLDCRGIEALILILQKGPQLQIWPEHWSDIASQPSDFHVGEHKIVRWCQIGRMWRVINQFKATVMHNSHCNHRLVCRSIVLVKRDSLRQFSKPFWNASSTTLQSPELLTQCGFIWKETMQLVSGKDEFNACQVSLLWHNSFLVGLWTFQPTLVFDSYIIVRKCAIGSTWWCVDISLYRMRNCFSRHGLRWPV